MATAVRELPDWDVGPLTYPIGKKIGLMVLLAAPVLILGLGISLLGGMQWDLGAAVTAAGWIAFVLYWQARVMRRILVGGGRTKPLDDVRFASLVRGLAGDHGLIAPDLFVIEDGGPNAIVVRRPKPRLAVTRALLDTYTRTELEAVAAHCLVRLTSGRLSFAHLAAALGRSGSRFAPHVGYEDDIHTAALTRYPPALASAIAKAKPASGGLSPFWFVAHDASHRHPTERIAALQDL